MRPFCSKCGGLKRCFCAKPKVMCKHCGERVAGRGKRGLCNVCFANVEIRLLYPRLNGRKNRRWEQEPTMAELEACIAEQRRRLPAWWQREAAFGPGDR